MNPHVVFTIVTRNYIPMANMLGDSIQRNQPDTDFMVFVINGFDKNRQQCKSKYTIIPVEDCGFDRLLELAFKYDLTEFCTAIKPKCFQYVFSLGYNKALYFDPDIAVFSSLESVFNALDNHFLVLTPHLLFPEVEYTGHWPQGRILAAGTFNLGFAGISVKEKTSVFLNWWDKNLSDYCFIERREGLFTDQKWMNFCPAYFPEMHIERSPGYNVALWNIHEREIVSQEGQYYIRKRNTEDAVLYPLRFFHFSNFLFKQAENDPSDFLPFSMNQYPDVMELISFYRSALIDSDFVKYNKQPDYTFNYFDNGVHINKIHRRLFRKLLQGGVTIENPFATVEGSFYSILKKNRLVIEERQNFDNVHLRSTKMSGVKFRLMKNGVRFFVRLVGIKRYTFLCRFLFWLTKYENQLFLIKEYDNMISESAPDGYINIKK